MATTAQIAANRRNGGKSNGPKTEPGRAAASRNALRHGLTADQVVLIFGESEDDFAHFHDEMRAAFAPADAVEEQLVEHAVLCAWRLRRAYRAEAASMNFRLDKIHQHHRKEGTHKTISRYEVANERSLHRALLMLERRQARRRNEPVPAPIAIQVEGLDGVEPQIAVVGLTHSALHSSLPDDATLGAEPPAEIG